MLNPDRIWLAEYSPVQGCFNIETAREAMECNVRQVMEGWTNSYLVFCVCESREGAGQACDELAEAMLRHGAKTDALGVTVRMPDKKRLAGRRRATPGTQTAPKPDQRIAAEREAVQARQGDAEQDQDPGRRQAVTPGGQTQGRTVEIKP